MIRTQPGSQWTVAREFRRRHQEPVRPREDLEIPFPQRRVHVRVEGGPAPIRVAHAAGRGGRRMSLRLYNTLTRRIEPFVPLAAGAGLAVHLRAHGLQLRPHRELPDLPVRGPAAPLARGQRVRGLPHHEPDRRGRPDHRRGRRQRASRSGRTCDPFARAFEEDRDWLRIQPPHAQPRATEYIAADDRADRGPAGQGRRLPGRGRLGLLRHRPVSGVRPAVASSTAASSGPAPASG